MTAPALFERDGWSLRTVEQDGETWFVAADVAKALGYRDAHNMARRLDADEVGYAEISTPGGPQKVLIISPGAATHLALSDPRLPAVLRQRLAVDASEAAGV